MKVAIYPGSFDPVTSGHLNIIRRGANIFDKLIVCVMVNAGKNPMFTLEERVELIRRVTSDLPNVEVDCSAELLADYARRRGSCVILKGLRAGSDFENEFQMALINRKINPELDTMFLTASSEYMFLSSSLVKELASYGADLSDFLPAEIIPDFQRRIEQRRLALQGEDIIGALYDMVQDARSMPLAADKCILERDKVLDMLDEIIAQLPAELKQSRTIVESRNELISQARREAENIVRQAQEQSKQMVTKEAIYVEAKKRSEELVGQTQAKIEQLRKAGNAYMDDSLRQTEEVVSKALAEIRETRMKFRTVTEAQQQRKTPNVDVEV